MGRPKGSGKPLCKRGHSMIDAYVDKRGVRQCRVCHSLHSSGRNRGGGFKQADLLYEMEVLTFGEIASAIGSTEGAVRQLYSSAMKRLRGQDLSGLLAAIIEKHRWLVRRNI